MALAIKTNKYCYFCNDNLPVGAAIPLFRVTKNKEFTGKICFTDGIVLAELLKSVGLDISFDANPSSSPRAACKKCARKIVNCSTLSRTKGYFDSQNSEHFNIFVSVLIVANSSFG